MKIDWLSSFEDAELFTRCYCTVGILYKEKGFANDRYNIKDFHFRGLQHAFSIRINIQGHNGGHQK